MSSLPQRISEVNKPPISALDHLWRRLPRRLVACDKADKYRGRRAMPKKWAVKLSEFAPNDDDRLTVIAVDCDLEPDIIEDPVLGTTVKTSSAAIAWIEAGVPTPNIVITSRDTLHAHFLWLLDDPINIATQLKAPRYADAIQAALTAAIPGGDPAFARSWRSNTIHNPWDEKYYSYAVHRNEPYRLDELAECLDLPELTRRKPGGMVEVSEDDEAIQTGTRNCEVHQRLAIACGRRLQRGKRVEESFVEEAAMRINGRCVTPLDPAELTDLTKSILRYWGKYAPRNRAAELKAIRASEGRTIEARTTATTERRKTAKELRTQGMSVSEIACALGVDKRTIYRYFSYTDVPVIYVIPMQDITGTGQAEGGGISDYRAPREVEKYPAASQKHTPSHFFEPVGVVKKNLKITNTLFELPDELPDRQKVPPGWSHESICGCSYCLAVRERDRATALSRGGGLQAKIAGVKMISNFPPAPSSRSA